jgi:tRNA-dihydrouridine synthase A
MRAAVRVPVTVKMRIGVVSATAGRLLEAIGDFGERDIESLWHFVESVRDAGCQAAIVHARKAVLGELSPKDNREIPPLRYDMVRRLKGAFPTLPIVVNGGLRLPSMVLDALRWCDGVMLGREAYHHPFLLAELHRALHPKAGDMPTREALVARMERYAAREVAAGQPLAAITRHMLGLYSGEPGARDFRRILSEGARAPGAGVELLRQAIPAAPRA